MDLERQKSSLDEREGRELTKTERGKRKLKGGEGMSVQARWDRVQVSHWRRGGWEGSTPFRGPENIRALGKK